MLFITSVYNPFDALLQKIKGNSSQEEEAACLLINKQSLPQILCLSMFYTVMTIL